MKVRGCYPRTCDQSESRANPTHCVAAYCIVPISNGVAEKLAGYSLIPIPADILPASFPAGKHPLIAQAGFDNDIRMAPYNTVPLQIGSLMQASLVIPYVNVLGNNTPISVPINYYIGGTFGQPLEALVPSIASGVSPFEGTTIFPANFTPDSAAVASLPDGIYSTQVKPYILPNTVSGPGVYAEAFDMLYTLTNASPYTPHTFHTLLNGPQLLNSGKCQRNTQYFNATFANPQMAVANVTIYHEILDSPPAGLEGEYVNVYCYQANAELVASYMQEPCGVAAANVDPVALQ